MKLRDISILGAVTASLLWSAALSAQTTREAPKAAPGPRVMPERFGLLLQKSIFSRERLRSASSRGPRIETSRPTRPPAAPILTGIVQADEGFVAFLEDQRTGRTSLARVGQQLAEGKIESMTLTYLVLRPTEGGEPRRIEISSTLSGDTRPSFGSSGGFVPTGGPIGGTSASGPSAGTPPGMGGGTASAGSMDGLDPAERLRRRRLAELGGGTPPSAPSTTEPGMPATAPVGPEGTSGSPPQMERPAAPVAPGPGSDGVLERSQRRRSQGR